jgi:two-component system cell cycle sensor histidine kinase/response regulator CckA
MGTDLDLLRFPHPVGLHDGPKAPWVIYGGSIVATVLAAGLSVALFPRPLSSPMAPFLIAAILAAWLGGFRPAILATVLSLGALLFLPYPPGAFTPSVSRLVVFGLVCLAIGAVAESLARSRRQAVDQAAVLEEQALELEMSNQELTESVEEAQQAREAAEAAEQRYRLLFDRNPAPMWVYDLQTLEFLAINDAAVAQYGYSREEFLGMTLRDIRPPEEVPVLLESHRTSPPGFTSSGIFRHRTRDGSIISVEIRSHDMAFGRRSGRVVLATNVTEALHVQEELRTMSERFRVLVDASPVAIVGFEPDRKVQSWNQAAERMFGWREAEVVGKPFPGASGGEVSALLSEADGGQSLSGVMAIAEQRDGTSLEVSVSSAPLRNSRGEIVGFVGVFEDVTDRRRTELALRTSEEQLRHAQKMEAIGRLAGGVAHDFNNILTAIQSYAEFLALELDTDPRYRDDIREIQKAADRAAQLTHQLLAFSRKQVLRPEAIDLNLIVTETERMLRRVIGEDIELVTRLAPVLGPLQGDAGQLSQVLVNLAINARDAMPEGGRLLIETMTVNLDEEYASRHREAVAGPHVLLSVSDTGIGMDGETKSRIFEPFFTTKEQGKGTGLGLSMVYGFVRQSGGSIWVYSEPGEGTTFKIYLPQAPHQGAGALTSAGRAHPRKAVAAGTTVLLVEDELAVRQVATRTLVEHGYAVLEAANGREALALALSHQGPIDLVLTDMVMPEMRGGELAERLRQERPEARLLMMSGYTEEAASRQAILAAGSAFLEKPFTASRLLEKVEEVLGGA